MATNQINKQQITLRSMADGDDEFLSGLYATTRDDLNQLPLPDEQKSELCHSQYVAQKHHYTNYFGDASFDVVLLDSQPVGRLYVHRTDDELRVIDIAVLPEFHRRGIGTQLMDDVMQEADRTRKPVRLRVHPDSPARHWYEKLGFQQIADEQINWHMERKANQ